MLPPATDSKPPHSTSSPIAPTASPASRSTCMPEQSHNYELGAKWRPEGGVAARAAAVPHRARATNWWWRATRAAAAATSNVDRSRRQGLEASLQTAVRRMTGRWRPATRCCMRSSAATSWSAPARRARCPMSRLPPVRAFPASPRQQGQVRLAWTPGLVEHGAGGDRQQFHRGQRHRHRVERRATGCGMPKPATTGARPTARCAVFARVENLLDRRYVGSVIVNEGNGRYFECGPGSQLRCWACSGGGAESEAAGRAPADAPVPA